MPKKTFCALSKGIGRWLCIRELTFFCRQPEAMYPNLIQRHIHWTGGRRAEETMPDVHPLAEGHVQAVKAAYLKAFPLHSITAKKHHQVNKKLIVCAGN
ncbi:MAG: hypothetical protein GY696_33665 [Gammaproteobacteria bacterium]|nr:hypothetical protein [Gammaproteobacteria bacterium]